MARQVAFVMQLPPLSEAQEIPVRRYGKEHCEEIRLVKSECATVFAGLLIAPFKSKKVAQTSFGLNLKLWKITHPKYTRNWYRELSLDEYFAEFAGVSSVLGRRMQTLVSSTVMRALRFGAATAMVRAEAKVAKAKRVLEKREKACHFQTRLVNQCQRVCFEALAVSIRIRHREQNAMRVEDHKSRKAAEFLAQEDKRKADLEHTERLKCPLFRAQLKRDRIEEEKKLQAANVAYHANKKRKVEQ
jgi:hypothetical protein